MFCNLDVDGSLVRQATFGTNLSVTAASVSPTYHLYPLVSDMPRNSDQLFLMDLSH